MRAIQINSGEKYGKLTVLNFSHSKSDGRYYLCECICGQKKPILAAQLKKGIVTSCGCRANIKSHGYTGTRLYSIWRNMRLRCHDPNSTWYKHYGARGIFVCDEWFDNFINFKNDMENEYLAHCKLHGERNTTLERIDNNSHYFRENCKWITQQEQANNTRNTYKFLAEYSNGYKEVGLTQAGFAKKYGLNYRRINDCLKGRQRSHKGWTFKRILTEDKD